MSERSERILVYLAAAAYGLTFWYLPAHDPDLGWHLAGGAWITRMHELPSADFINSFNPRWHDYHWLAQIGLYALYRIGSYELLRGALGVLMAVLSVVVMSIILSCSRRRPASLLHLAAFLGAMILVGNVAAVRPQMLSILLLALALRRLLQRPTWWELPYLFGLAVLAANVHVYWVFIPTLWALYRALPRLLRRRAATPAYAWGGLALLGAAALVSPYGLVPFGAPPHVWFMNYALIWDYLTMPAQLSGVIHEFKSALAADFPIPLVMVVYVAVAARSFRGRRALADLPNAVAAALSGVLALRELKFIAVFGILGLPYFVRHAAVPWQRKLVERLPWLRIAQPVLVLVLLGGSLAHAARHFPWTAPNNVYLLEMQPIEACRRIASLDLPPPKHGHYRVLTHFNHGGWCRFEIYEQNPDADFRVTTDGRTQGVPPEHFLLGFDLYNMQNDALQTLKRWDPDVIVVPVSKALAKFLALAPAEYRLVYHDANFAVFVPTH